MHAFFAPPGMYAGGKVTLDADESKHASKVLRLEKGDRVRLIDGEGHAFEGEISSFEAGEVTLDVLSELPPRESPVSVTVYQGYPKSDKLELITQKLTELGMRSIVPVVMRYSVAKPKGGQERLERISREAVKQCGRSFCPVIPDPVTFRQALEMMEKHDLMLMPWENAQGLTLTGCLMDNRACRDIGILIGPEGGISPEEAQQAEDAGALAVTLGERILRCETAAIESASVTMALTEEWAKNS